MSTTLASSLSLLTSLFVSLPLQRSAAHYVQSNPALWCSQRDITGEDDLLKVKEIEVIFNDVHYLDALDSTPNLKSLTCALRLPRSVLFVLMFHTTSILLIFEKVQ